MIPYWLADLIVGAASIVFLVSLIPMVLSKSGVSIPLKSSLLTSAGLYTIAIVFLLLPTPLYFSGIITTASAFLWSILACQMITA